MAIFTSAKAAVTAINIVLMAALQKTKAAVSEMKHGAILVCWCFLFLPSDSLIH